MPKTKNWKEKYDRLSSLGSGGNGKVYKVQSKKNKNEVALKELTSVNEERKARFTDEINVMKDNFNRIDGIIPILEYSIKDYWYTMPIAIPITEYIITKKSNILEIVQGTIEICSTLEKLHEKGISHRDIKPANIYYYENRFYLGDFGLVEFPESINDFTRSDRGLGAIFTIAPEMKRNPKIADGKKADVFSLAKTMWMFLTNDNRGFDGVYNFLDYHHSLRSIQEYTNVHTAELDILLKAATDNNPDNRPTIEQFKEQLTNWTEIYLDNDRSQASDWDFLTRQIFGEYIPETSSWRKNQKIIDVLNIIGRTPAYNHMFFSHGGGLDFSYATIASEENCVKLYDTSGFCHLVKPKILHYEGFDSNFKWNYFLLELDELKPILESNAHFYEEYLVEDSPAHYVSAEYVQYGVYDYDTGQPLPQGCNTVYRFTRGKILIVMKNGPYNKISETYDGRHGDCSSNDFRDYIERLIEEYSRCFSYVRDNGLSNLENDDLEYIILNHKPFSKNPFKIDTLEESTSSLVEKSVLSNQKSENFVKLNFTNWNFLDLMKEYKPKDRQTINFSFEFDADLGLGFSIEKFLGNSVNILCTNGFIKKNDFNNNLTYYLYDRNQAINLKMKLEKRISEILENSDLRPLEYKSCFSIKFTKIGNPKHLFTKKEIESAMKKADDRHNNVLVIDENGYAKVISDTNQGYLYPVRHESWNAGNVYVGKYSKLSTLDDVYLSSLQGWLYYLENGRSQYIDIYYLDKNEGDLLQEINKYYK